ncbi:hypothetical protein AU15_18645 [Marinobacter salarius]|uniref:Uncharacterized protein n=1 Tax=Marinobacter salarius TaxID=1420917 RepID=W5YWX0_9GAMM|nr:hypothetical protein AU15_18645 [Marinobacter salarius]
MDHTQKLQNPLHHNYKPGKTLRSLSGQGDQQVYSLVRKFYDRV